MFCRSSALLEETRLDQFRWTRRSDCHDAQAIFIFKISFVIIILIAALIGLLGGRCFPKKFPTGKGHGKFHGGELPCVELPPAPLASIGRTILVSTLCLTLWWLPVLAAG